MLPMTLNEMSQGEKDKHYTVSFTWNLKKKIVSNSWKQRIEKWMPGGWDRGETGRKW